MVVAFQQLVGQDEATRRLTALASSGRVPHALLFIGQNSVGKRTAARILAQVLLCTGDRSPGTACGVCPGCQKFEGGNHGDYTEVATEDRNLKIAAIRDATRQLALRPVEGGKKVLLIDDAEKMVWQAQNALLKTLEEPPGDAHLILVTSRLRSILPTVVSRCQRIAFKPIPTERVAQMVAERLGVDERQAMLLAALASGSLGRAIELDPAEVIERRDQVAELDEKLEPSRAKSAIEALEGASTIASDRAELLACLPVLETWLHDQMLIAAGPRGRSVANLDREADLVRLAERRGLPRILRRLDTVLEARRQLELPYNFNPLMIAEQMCLQLAGHVPFEVADRQAL
ncbi:MAG: DNA polymerase III subunit delta' [Deltaproteobacteria bacterium]